MGKVNSKGVFITFMVFLLVVSILTLHDVAETTNYKQERKYIDEVAFNKVNNSFNNLYEEVVSLNKEGPAKDVQQRPMPFQYDFNENAVILSQRIPVKTSMLTAYVDALNIYSIFADKNATADLNIATNAIQDSRWGGVEDFADLNYAILPQCLLYDINACCPDLNMMILRELADSEFGCSGGFDYADLNIVDINITVNTTAYIDQTPPLQGTLASSTDAFDPLNTLPYVRITINEINPQCPGAGCHITRNEAQPGIAVRTAHFDPAYTLVGTEDTLIIPANASDEFKIKIGCEKVGDLFPIVISNTLPTTPIYVDLNITFDQKPELVYFTQWNILC